MTTPRSRATRWRRRAATIGAAFRVFASPWDALLFLLLKAGRLGGRDRVALRVRALGGPAVEVRPGTTDAETLWNTFFHGYHLPAEPIPDPRVIVDLGANVGYTCCDFATRHPHARIVGLEMDAANHRLAVTNTEPYRDRCTVEHAAVWTDDENVVYEGDRADAFRIVQDAAGAGGRSVSAYRLDTLFERYELERVDFLKMDVEGAEAAILRGAGDWLDRVEALGVEVHGGFTAAEAREILERRGFSARIDPRHPAAVAARREVRSGYDPLVRRSGRRLRVLHLIKGLGRGGAERLLVDVLRHADRTRFEYAYGYFLSDRGDLAEDLGRLGATVVCFDARGSAGVLLRTSEVRRFAERWCADVIHCHLPISGVAGRLAAAPLGLPVVYTEHNLIERYHPLTRQANLATWNRQARVLAVSEEVAGSIRRNAGASPPVEVVLNGVDLAHFRPDPELGRRMRATLGLPDGAPVIGQIAVFRPQKRLDLWLDAAAAIHAERPDARFLLVGDGPERSRIERRAGELGLADAVHFAGLQDDVRPYYAALDLYLVASDYEGLPVALLEAMASALAIVSTAVGGVPEAIRDGVEGTLVPAGDPRALAAAALRMIGDPAERARQGAAARERAGERFSTERMTRRLEAIYDEVAGDRR